MEFLFYATLLLLASFSRGNENTRREEESDIENDKAENDAEAFESFGSPVYGLNSILKTGLNGKSAYNAPVPALPPNFAAYFASLGLANPYAYAAYNRLGFSPYAYPSSYGYGSTLLNNPAFNSALLSGYGYGGYGGPYFGRSVYPGYGYGYPGYNAAALGYRYGGLGYGPAALRGAAAIPGLPAPVAGVPAPARIPAPVPALPPALPNAIPAVAAPVPAGLPFGPLRRIQNKDGTVRYGYAPADVPALPVY